MIWETSIQIKYGRWHRGYPFDSSVNYVNQVQYLFAMIQYTQSETRKCSMCIK